MKDDMESDEENKPAVIKDRSSALGNLKPRFLVPATTSPKLLSTLHSIKMVLEVIYIVRHGFRSNWVVDPKTGTYSASTPTPTGIPSDPALAGYGVDQAKQLGQHLLTVDPPVDLIYSSPFYRCLQTLKPFVDALAERKGQDKVTVNIERGIGEFYGLARFDHPSPAPITELNRHFKHLRAEAKPIIIPSTKGESTPQLHNRLAYCLKQLIERADKDPSQPKSLLICTHAAAMIALGRALTGLMPEDENTDDFNCFTCSFSKFVRRNKPDASTEEDPDPVWSPEKPEQIPDIGWRGGKGVVGGWDCKINGDCSFLSGGEERGWKFSGDESFIADPNAFNDQVNASTETREISASGLQHRNEDHRHKSSRL